MTKLLKPGVPMARYPLVAVVLLFWISPIAEGSTIFTFDTATKELMALDPSDAAPTVVGFVGFQITGLAYDSSADKIFTTDPEDSLLLTIDPVTVAVNVVGPLRLHESGCPLTPNLIVALTFGPGGELFGLTNNQASTSCLVKVNTVNGRTTSIGFDNKQLSGLAYQPLSGEMYACYGFGGGLNGLFLVDPETGDMSTKLRSVNIDARHLAPDPESAKLYLARIAGSVFRSSRLELIEPRGLEPDQILGGISRSYHALEARTAPPSLDFSEIASPQTAGTSFHVTVTARAPDGSQLDLDGTARLSASTGLVIPENVGMVSGEASFDVILPCATSRVQLSARLEGLTGTSNSFTVSGSGPTTGSVGGHVADPNGVPLEGQTIFLSKGTETLTETTDSQGAYEFTGLDSGRWLVSMAATSTTQAWRRSVDISCDLFRTIDIVQEPQPAAECLGPEPVLLVPDFMGSSLRDGWRFFFFDSPALVLATSFVPVLDFNVSYEDPNWGPGPLAGLFDPLGWVGWEQLVRELQQRDATYQPGRNIFALPYDWRLGVDEIVNDYLRLLLADVKNQTGCSSVKIVAHGFGALVVRSYIQGPLYEGDVSQVALIGPPNHGIAAAYYMWEGGAPWTVDFEGSLGGSLLPFYTATSLVLLKSHQYISHRIVETAIEKTIELGLNETAGKLAWKALLVAELLTLRDNLLRLYSEHVDSLQELLPIGTVPLTCSENPLLPQLNQRPWPGDVEAVIFASDSEPTPTTLALGPADCAREYYRDGHPRWFALRSPGDNTVPLSSAFLASVGTTTVGAGPHRQLVGRFASDVADFLLPGPATPPALAPVDIPAASVALLIVSADGTQDLLLTAPGGQRVGVDPVDGWVMELSGASFDREQGTSIVRIQDPASGTYTLSFSGGLAGSFLLSASYGPDVESVVRRFDRGFYDGSASSTTLFLDPPSESKVSFVSNPQPPEELVASPGVAGTSLSWQASGSPDVQSYNVYARVESKGIFEPIGSTAGFSFLASQPWDDSPSTPTTYYAVTAELGDGTESLFSNPVGNNDQDGDQSPDEEELVRGTNVMLADTDGDGLDDGSEPLFGSDPLVSDTDGDGYSDGTEVDADTDPLDAANSPADLVLLNDTNTESEVLAACRSILAHLDYEIGAGADVEFRVGQVVRLGNDFRVAEGARFTATIDPAFTCP